MCEARVSELRKQFSQSLVVRFSGVETISNWKNLWRQAINRGDPTDKRRREAPLPVFKSISRRYPAPEGPVASILTAEYFSASRMMPRHDR
jgi:hypothetical protein